MMNWRIVIISALAWGVAVAEPGPQAKKNLKILQPWLEPEKGPTQGTDSNIKDLVVETIPLIQAAAPGSLSAPMPSKRKVLVLTTDTAGVLHIPGAAGLLILLRATERKHPNFEFTEAFSVDDIPADGLGGFDAVILNNISQVNNPKHRDFFNNTLTDYVRAGGGVLGIHGSTLPLRTEAEAEYNKMMGGFVTENPVHPGKGGSAFPTVVPDPSNPLSRAFLMEPQTINTMGQWLAGKNRKLYGLSYNAPETLADELYTFNPLSNADGQTRVILAIDKGNMAGMKRAPEYPEGTSDFGYALAWYKTYGNGRVYYTQFGHNFSIFVSEAVSHGLIDGLQYVCGDLKVE